MFLVLKVAALAGWAGNALLNQLDTFHDFLHHQGHVPRDYAQFLRYTTERRLTQQIGGRFRFIHRELLDHFAAMDIEAQSQFR